MTEVEANKKRLKAMLALSAVAALVAIASIAGAVVMRQDWLLAVFGAAMVVGFGAQIWFIVGLGRTKKGV